MMRKNSYLLLGIVLLVAGVVFAIRWWTHGEIHVVGLVCFLPGGVLLAAHLLDIKNRRSALYHIIVIFIFTLSLGLCVLVGAQVEMFMAATATVTDVGEYRDVRSQRWHNQDLIRHFPIEIPETAKMVRFSFFPGFLQGGAHIQLRLRLPSEESERIYEEYIGRAARRFIGGDSNTHMNKSNGYPTTFFYTGDTGATEFPDSYEILVLGPCARRGSAERQQVNGESDAALRAPRWNHGRSYGVAIDRKHSVVVYWAASW